MSGFGTAPSVPRTRSVKRPDGEDVGTKILPIANLSRRLSSAFLAPDTSRSLSLIQSPEERQAARMRAMALAAEADIMWAEKDPMRTCWELHVSSENGLSSAEAAKRLASEGRNELQSTPPPTFFEVFLDQFKDVVVIILLVGAVISMFLGEYAAGAAILIIVSFNASLGVKMELSANSALTDLKNSNPESSEVIRDGQVKEVPTYSLVPGDIVILSLGKKIPADMRLITSAGLEANEMPLTGESVPCKKDANFLKPSDDDAKSAGASGEEEGELNPRNLVFMGCLIETGNGKGVVIHTGMRTRMGSIQRQLDLADDDISPLAKKLTGLGQMLGLASIFISVVVLLLMIFYLKSTWIDALLVAVSLTVAAVPEGLPVCVTIALAVGMKTMADKHRAQVMRLKSVETLGSASVICSDKTGTLTKGEMTAVGIWMSGKLFRFTGTGYDPEGLFIPEGEADNVYNNPERCRTASDQLKGSIYTLTNMIAALCSNAVLQYNEEERQWEASGNISERPLVVAAVKTGFKIDEIKQSLPRVKENPFSSIRKMMSTLHEVPDGSAERALFGGATHIACIKGAPNVVLSKCSRVVNLGPEQESMQLRGGQALPTMALGQLQREAILKQIDSFSSQAYRVLAIAIRPFDQQPKNDDEETLESDMVLVGLVASIDPDRPEVKPAIEGARKAGIRVVMITGDYVKTAKAIAENISILPRKSNVEKSIDCVVIRELGARETDLIEREREAGSLGGQGLKLIKKDLEDVRRQLDSVTAYADVYARAKPEDKITIVRSLQRQGNICSMTGDGVNDAPALKQANIGVAMGITGTDVAKSAADMILLDDNFVAILAAIRQGRIIYANIQKFCYFLLSTNVAEVIFMVMAVSLGMQPPLVPLQILWLNLATDGAPAVALAVEEAEPGVMEEGPRPQEEPLMSKLMLTGIGIQTVVLSFCSLWVYMTGLKKYLGNWRYEFETNEDGQIDELEQLELRKAQTMCILFIVFAELLRAYGARSLRNSIFTVGPFTNWYMQPACGVSVVGTILIAFIPGVNNLFGMTPIEPSDWGFVIGMAFIPFCIDELTKVVYRKTDFGLRKTTIDRGRQNPELVKQLSLAASELTQFGIEKKLSAADFSSTTLNSRAKQ